MRFIKILYNKIQCILNKNIIVDFKSGVNVWKAFKCDKHSRILAKKISTRKNCHIEAKKGGCIVLGDNLGINYNSIISCHKKIIIGNDCLIGPNVMIYDHDHDYNKKNWRNEYKESEIEIGNNVWICGNVTILKGSKIGDNCIIGANTLIKGEVIENNTIVYSDNVHKKRKFERIK